jgi:hypothetical protein
MKLKQWLVGFLVAAQALAVAPAFAGSKGRMNTAALLTGAAVYSWMSHAKHPSAGRRNTALLTTAGAAYGWYNYNRAKKSERAKERRRSAYYRSLAARNARLARYYRTRASRARYASRVSRARYARR